jgi:hypothetical protein
VQLAGRVQGADRERELARRGPNARGARRPRGARPGDEIDPLDQLHREEALPVVDDEVVELDEVRVRQVGKRAELALETVDALRLERVQRLQGDGAAAHPVVRPVDQALTALTDEMEAFILGHQR